MAREGDRGHVRTQSSQLFPPRTSLGGGRRGRTGDSRGRGGWRAGRAWRAGQAGSRGTGRLMLFFQCVFGGPCPRCCSRRPPLPSQTLAKKQFHDETTPTSTPTQRTPCPLSPPGRPWPLAAAPRLHSAARRPRVRPSPRPTVAAPPPRPPTPTSCVRPPNSSPSGAAACAFSFLYFCIGRSNAFAGLQWGEEVRVKEVEGGERPPP